MMSSGRRRARSTITVTNRRRLSRDARFMTFSSRSPRTAASGGYAALVGEQSDGEVPHRPHHRLPDDPELPCHRRDRRPSSPDLPVILCPRPFSQHRPRQDVRVLLPPRPAAVPAAPLPLAPHQPGLPSARPGGPGPGWRACHPRLPVARTHRWHRRHGRTRLTPPPLAHTAPPSS